MKMWSGRFGQPQDPDFERWQSSFRFDRRMGRRSILLLRGARPPERVVESLHDNCEPQACDPATNAQARDETHPRCSFPAGPSNRDPARICVCGYLAVPIFRSQFHQRCRVGERHHVRHPMARTDVDVCARCQSLVGAGDSSGHRGVVLQMALESFTVGCGLSYVVAGFSPR